MIIKVVILRVLVSGIVKRKKKNIQKNKEFYKTKLYSQRFDGQFRNFQVFQQI